MDTTKRSPLDRLLFATFLKGRTSSRDVWEEKGDMNPDDNQKIIEETNEIINDDSTYPYLGYLTTCLLSPNPPMMLSKNYMNTLTLSQKDCMRTAPTCSVRSLQN